jgi:hypothetical protein
MRDSSRISSRALRSMRATSWAVKMRWSAMNSRVSSTSRSMPAVDHSSFATVQ